MVPSKQFWYHPKKFLQIVKSGTLNIFDVVPGTIRSHHPERASALDFKDAPLAIRS